MTEVEDAPAGPRVTGGGIAKLLKLSYKIRKPSASANTAVVKEEKEEQEEEIRREANMQLFVDMGVGIGKFAFEVCQSLSCVPLL